MAPELERVAEAIGASDDNMLPSVQYRKFARAALAAVERPPVAEPGEVEAVMAVLKASYWVEDYYAGEELRELAEALVAALSASRGAAGDAHRLTPAMAQALVFGFYDDETAKVFPTYEEWKATQEAALNVLRVLAARVGEPRG